ncbi:MAG: phage tail protein [Actinobacteria bacterium]|nr:phage tail protein [Actinomycetota bacterium]
MAIERNDPYGAFNFLVQIDGEVHGFQEVSGLGIMVDVIEYRNGNELVTRKLAGRHRYQNAVLRRGVMGSLGLYTWIDHVTRQNRAAARSVGITLLDENQTEVVRWNLRQAWPIRYEGPTLNASTSQVAIEELVLTYESMEML